jgi:hypothetical protein
MKSRWIPVVFLGAMAIWNPSAHAYLDPGTGSIVLQVILGGIAGALVAGKLYWSKLKRLIGRDRSEKPSQRTDESR